MLVTAVGVREEPERKVYTLRHVGPYRTILKSFQRVGAHAAARKQRPTCVIGVFCDDPSRTPAMSLESYACMEVMGPLVPGNGVDVKTIPGGTVVTAVATGPYGGDAVTAAYRAVHEFARSSHKYEAPGTLPHSSFEFAAREIYLDPPPEGSGEDPSTEVVLPIRKR